MKSPIKKAYESFDNFMMYGANKAVHAWNWTTGRTKADLSNLLLDGAIISFAGFFLSVGPSFAPVSLIVFPSVHGTQRYHIKLEQEEATAAENGLKNLEVEEYKRDCEFASQVSLALSTYFVPFIPFLVSEQEYQYAALTAFTSLTFASLSASAYIMRADYLPPQKNCISRAKDKLAEMIKEYKARPELIPVEL